MSASKSEQYGKHIKLYLGFFVFLSFVYRFLDLTGSMKMVVTSILLFFPGCFTFSQYFKKLLVGFVLPTFCHHHLGEWLMNQLNQA
jgi:hypothetical protein